MAGFKFVVTGADPLIKTLTGFKGKLSGIISDNVSNMGMRFEALAKKATPVDTGRMRASITSQNQGQQTVVGTNVEYASFVEYGTSKMDARHVEGAQARVLGVGPFTYAMEQFKSGIKNGAKEIAKDIEGRFAFQALRGILKNIKF